MKRGLFSKVVAGMFAGIAIAGTATAAPAVATPADAADTAANVAATAQLPGRTLRVMPLGDSITAGVGSTTKSSYRSDLRKKLVAAGMAVNFVGSQKNGVGYDNEHEGHGGWTIDQIAAELDGWLATYQPDVVIVHLGTNNVTRGESAPVIARKLDALVDRIRAGRPDAMIFVSKIIGSKVPAERAVDNAYNARIPGIVAAKGANVRLVDQSSVGGIDLLDRHHPNNFGYNKMTYNFYRAFEQVYATSAWPATVNPYRLTTTYRCLWKPVTRPDGTVRNTYDCSDWVLQKVQGKDRWVTKRTVTVSYRAWSDGRYVTKTKQVQRWVGPGEFLAV